jgi:hypothetical protein
MNDFISEATAKDICNLMMCQKVTTKQLRDMLTTCNDAEYEAGLAYAMRKRWVRPAHVGDNLTLTSHGIRAATS